VDRDQLTFLKLLAIGSLAIELLGPAVLVDKRLARLWAVHALLMHWDMFFIMKIKFRYQMSGLMYAPFFDVERVVMIFDRRDRVTVSFPPTAPAQQPTASARRRARPGRR